VRIETKRTLHECPFDNAACRSDSKIAFLGALAVKNGFME
jgi:hypothetical protein